MNLTVKRLLILFSVCLNIGFLASAAHHALSEDMPRPRRIFIKALDSVDMSDVQRRAMLALDDRLHGSMSQWRQETLDIKRDSFDAMTAEDGPDQARLEANLDREVAIMRDRIKEANSIFVQGLDILGREKLRQFGESLLSGVEDR